MSVVKKQHFFSPSKEFLCFTCRRLLVPVHSLMPHAHARTPSDHPWTLFHVFSESLQQLTLHTWLCFPPPPSTWSVIIFAGFYPLFPSHHLTFQQSASCVIKHPACQRLCNGGNEALHRTGHLFPCLNWRFVATESSGLRIGSVALCFRLLTVYINMPSLKHKSKPLSSLLKKEKVCFGYCAERSAIFGLFRCCQWTPSARSVFLVNDL